MSISLPSRRLVSQDDASITQRADVPRSVFKNRWSRLTTFNARDLVPFMVDEILPGDHVRYSATAYIRMSTLVNPIFDNQRIDTFFFYVPARILWTNWVRMNGEQSAPTDSIDYTVPQITLQEVSIGELADYMGIPTEGQTGAAAFTVNALPFRAYTLIFNEWFRDQNLQGALVAQTGDGPDTEAMHLLQKRAKSHDYFTSALPWPQKFTAPTVPLGGSAPVVGIGTTTASASGVTMNNVRESDLGTVSYPFYHNIEAASFKVLMNNGTGGAFPQIYADLSAATGVDINVFRQAFMVQSLLERDARGGTRYSELIKAHWGVTNPDFRLQRPEYIGGGQTPLNITPIAQTAPTAGAEVGTLGAVGTAAGNHSASYAATEHGYILGLINIRSELSYSQGLHKLWSRQTRYDFYMPALAQLGEQAILRKEIYFTGDPTNDDVVFGYQERWHEYRTRTSEVTASFRPYESTGMSSWHLSQLFVTAPTLNSAFVEDNTDVARVIAAGETATDLFQEYMGDIYIERTITRAIPTFGTPAILGRF